MTSNHGVVRLDIATHAWQSTGVTTPTTAFGYGHDQWWYGNGGPGNDDARTLYRMKPELVVHPVLGPRPVIERIGTGARRIEDVASSPDGLILYGVGEGYLFMINRTTGVQTDIGPTGFAPLGVAVTNNLRLVAADDSNLYELDRNTGAATLIGAITPGTNDLAGMPNLFGTPATSKVGLLGLALLLVLGGGVWARYRVVARS